MGRITLVFEFQRGFFFSGHAMAAPSFCIVKFILLLKSGKKVLENNKYIKGKIKKECQRKNADA